MYEPHVYIMYEPYCIYIPTRNGQNICMLPKFHELACIYSLQIFVVCKSDIKYFNLYVPA